LRSPSVREQALLDLLLWEDLPGADELRAQRQSVRVKGLWHVSRPSCC
jgi:hypothetical protein